MTVSTQEIPSLDQLLLGFTEWGIIASTFVLPALSFIGLLLCALSFWIFFQNSKIQFSSTIVSSASSI